MDKTIVNIIKDRIEAIEKVQRKFLSDELDKIVDSEIYIKTFEMKTILLEILIEYYETNENQKDMRDIEDAFNKIYENKNS